MGMLAASAISRRAFADARNRNISFALLFAFVSYVNVVGYRNTYPTLTDRLAFAHSFGGNASVRLFYGKPYDLLTVGGYSAWRLGGVLTIFAAMWGVLAAVRALRAEEVPDAWSSCLRASSAAAAPTLRFSRQSARAQPSSGWRSSWGSPGRGWQRGNPPTSASRSSRSCRC